MREETPVRVGLALGGGAARGLAHLGVLQCLEEENIALHCIAGSSFGALCGGLYAAQGKAAAMLQTTRAFLRSETYQKLSVHIFRNSYQSNNVLDGMWRSLKKGLSVGGALQRTSVVGEEEYQRVMELLLPEIAIEDMKLPFCATSVDLRKCEELLFTTGSLRRAVMASCAIPGLFPPRVSELHYLVDGSWANSVPIEPARKMGADIVIAVDVAPDPKEPLENKKSVEIAWLANTATRMILKRRILQEADIVLAPEVERIHWADFSALEEARTIGYEATKQAMPAIRELMAKRQPQRHAWWKL